MRRTILMLAAAAAGLAACGEKPANETATIAPTDSMSQEDVKQAVGKASIKPGEWQSSFTLEKIDLSGMPGASAQMEDQMKRMMSRTDIKHCVTPEEAENPGGDMFSGQENKDCTYKGFDMSGGRIAGQVECKSEEGVMNAIMSGTHTADSYDMTMDMKMAGGPDGMTMAMKARTEGKWIGGQCAKDAG
ncbi:hypothetical protein GGR44_001473 [Sphingobium fontiphilum]|uniref:DUF3617 domain-containing protein n=1 Tax=Sphingobium fontiphilum TaxID=944425 RepID=A0A7W6GQ87_9SPHN|nr:DUF3617 domain-containing protein [Sphingobium fontiphilum]MBB3981814.1 hypothetical protein [Sphingobium fontiphilum]